MNAKTTLLARSGAWLILLVFTSACSLVSLCPQTAPCPTLSCPTSTPEPSLVGTWRVVSTWNGEQYSGNEMVFVFETDGDFIFYMQGTEIQRGQYAVLETISPTGLNVIYDDGGVFYSIFEFTGPNTMRLENSFVGKPRPAIFNEVMTLERTNP